MAEVILRELSPGEVQQMRRTLERMLRAALAASISGRAHRPEAEAREALDAAIHDPSYRTLVAEAGDSIVGILAGSVRDGTGFILWIAVAEAHRRGGVASLLVERFAVANGLQRLRGIVNDTDEVATAFWSRQGWQPARFGRSWSGPWPPQGPDPRDRVQGANS